MAWQLGMLIVFWGVSSFTLVVQENHLPPASLNPIEQISQDRFRPDPWTYYPLEYNPWNQRETLIEAIVIYLGLLYGIFRLINIMRIIGEDDREALWSDFWSLCEQSQHF
jgi:hypothetical protein